MKRVGLVRRPLGEISADDFVVDEIAEPTAAAGEVITRTRLVSLDPYLVLRMRGDFCDDPAGPPYPIVSRTIGEVLDPGTSGYARGDFLLGFGAWSEIDRRPSRDLRRVEPLGGLPLSVHLGALGHSGFTAWLGLEIGELRSGEVVCVSGAAGAVGSTVGLLAKARGCRVIGIAGGADKTERLVRDHGFDVALDHRLPDLGGRLIAAAPDGIDLHFENVGAATLDPVLAAMRTGGRVVLCGMVQHYESTAPVILQNFRRFFGHRVRLLPFSIYDHEERFADAHRDLARLLEGRVIAETVTSGGIEALPAAFVAMLRGTGMGKHVAAI